MLTSCVRYLGSGFLPLALLGLALGACGGDSLPATPDGGKGDKGAVDAAQFDGPKADGPASDGVIPPDQAEPPDSYTGDYGDIGAGVCGNGKVESDETCDTAIAAGLPGACITDCDDGVACTTDTLSGGGTCQASCGHTFVVTCDPTTSDGCCPKTCTSATDIDCAATATCGDGVLDKGESCDTAIPAGTFGACPADCDDGDTCTQDDLLGQGCNVTCSNTQLKCKALVKDGCCPAGCTILTDPDCPFLKLCGNGKLDLGETCDTAIPAGQKGACPTKCDDGNACTADTFTGANCNLACSYTQITQCKPLLKDGCCPLGCTALKDADCTATNLCGNGTVDKGETCDTAIAVGKPGACPATCDDGNDCTTDKFTGSKCTLACSNATITQCNKLLKDGCCPTGCTFFNDADCSLLNLCGNGKIDKGETCDTAIPAGQLGACPTSCDDKLACTIDSFTGSACTLACAHKQITGCSGLLKPDGCCPPGCTALNDADCKVTNLCGNGKVDAGETCDTAIPAGQVGACPTTCDDGKPCTIDLFTGSACTLACSHLGIKSCSGLKSDGCCPLNCTPLTDVDCKK